MLAFHSMRELWYGLVVGGTLAIAAGGLYGLSAHMYAEGKAADLPSEWPVGTTLRVDPTGLTAVMFVHPRCPCTTVALAELEQLLVNSRSELRVQVVSVSASADGQQLTHGPLARRIAACQNFELIWDIGARDVRHFGVSTSGHFVLFDSRGHKLIDGGLTNGRGAEGPSAGLSALAAILAGQVPRETKFPVYGCGLIDG